MKRNLLLIPILILTSCQENTYEKIKNYLDTMEIVDRGWMTKEVALDVAKHIFRDNAMEIFRIK